MKTFNFKRLSYILAILMILTGNFIGINALATGDGGVGDVVGNDNAPDGVLVGYQTQTVKVKSGEHLESMGGWVGAQFTHLVVDYNYILCCKKTLRAMDGCKGLSICPN